MKLTTMQKPIIHKAIILILLCLGPAGPAWAEQKAHKVGITELKELALGRSYRLIGSLEPDRKLKVINQETGRILELPYYEGDSVKKGAILVRIDDEKINAEFNKAIANRKQAVTDLDRLKKLQPRNLASEDEVARAETQLELTRAEEALLRTRLNDARIIAPFNGIISERLMDKGDLAPAYSHILSFYDPESMIIKLRLPPQLLDGIPRGRFSVRIPTSRLNRTPNITLKRIFPGLDSQTHQVIVELQAEASPSDLAPGMLAEIEYTPEPEMELWLPLKALQEDAQGRFVYVQLDGKALRKPVSTGKIRADHIRITGGLQAGEAVITAGFIGLRDGKPVTREKENAHD